MVNKCMCCQHEFEGDVGRCPICKFVVAGIVGNDVLDVTRKNAALYRAELLGDMLVSVEGHVSQRVSDEVQEKGTEAYPLVKCDKMEFEEPVWLDQPFARQISQEKVSLTVLLQHQGKTVKKTVTLDAPKEEDLWYVGAELRPDLKLKFLVKAGKNSNCVSASEEISLLNI